MKNKNSRNLLFRVMWQDHIWWVVMVKLDINAHNFWHSRSNSIKVTFLSNPFEQYIFCLVPRRSAFSHCFPLSLVMTSYDVISGHMVFKFAYFVELFIDYQPAKFQCCRLSLACFIDRLRKTMMMSSWLHFMLLGLENLKFCETEYRLSPLSVF